MNKSFPKYNPDPKALVDDFVDYYDWYSPEDVPNDFERMSLNPVTQYLDKQDRERYHDEVYDYIDSFRFGEFPRKSSRRNRKANEMNNSRQVRRNRLASLPTGALLNELHNRKRIARRRKQAYKKQSSRFFESLLDTYGEDQLLAFVDDEPGAGGIEREVLNYLDGDMSQLEDLKEDIRYDLESISLYDQY